MCSFLSRVTFALTKTWLIYSKSCTYNLTQGGVFCLSARLEKCRKLRRKKIDSKRIKGVQYRFLYFVHRYLPEQITMLIKDHCAVKQHHLRINEILLLVHFKNIILTIKKQINILYLTVLHSFIKWRMLCKIGFLKMTPNCTLTISALNVQQ